MPASRNGQNPKGGETRSVSEEDGGVRECIAEGN